MTSLIVLLICQYIRDSTQCKVQLSIWDDVGDGNRISSPASRTPLQVPPLILLCGRIHEGIWKYCHATRKKLLLSIHVGSFPSKVLRGSHCNIQLLILNKITFPGYKGDYLATLAPMPRSAHTEEGKASNELSTKYSNWLVDESIQNGSS